jgi:integrase
MSDAITASVVEATMSGPRLIDLDPVLEAVRLRKTTWARKQRTPTTLETYRKIYNEFNTFPSRPTESTLDKVRRFVEAKTNNNFGRLCYYAMKSAFIVQRWTWFDPEMDPLPAPSDRVERPFYSKEEIDKLLAVARKRNIRDYLLLRIMWLAGPRRIQMSRLRTRDWNPQRGTLMIPAAKNTPAGEWLADPDTKEVMKEYLRGHHWAFLFPSRNGRSGIGPQDITYLWTEYCKLAGVKYRDEGFKHGKGSHGARRGRVTYMYAPAPRGLGMREHDITKALRWSSERTVHTYIQEMAGEVQEEIARRDPYYGAKPGG